MERTLVRAKLLALQSHIPDFRIPDPRRPRSPHAREQCNAWLATLGALVCDMPCLDNRLRKTSRLLRTRRGHDAGTTELAHLLDDAIAYSEVSGNSSPVLDDGLRRRWEVRGYSCSIWCELPGHYLPSEICKLRVNECWAAARPIEERDPDGEM
jgi:hypothetical protein